jgi:hypothetical protein
MIYHISDVILFADDTVVLVTNDNYSNFKRKANLALSFQGNRLVLNIEKTSIVKFTPIFSLYAPVTIKYTNKFIEETYIQSFWACKLIII